jgi:hypothetical protein
MMLVEARQKARSGGSSRNRRDLPVRQIIVTVEAGESS